MAKVDCLPTVAPYNSDPVVEILADTKVAVQFADYDATMCGSPHVQLCSSCRDVEDVCPRAAAPGIRYVCPACGRCFVISPTYETGSGRTTIGRDIMNFMVRPFPAELRELADWVMTNSISDGLVNSIVCIILPGADFCAKCAIGMPRSTSHACAKHVSFHRDRGGGSNSQAASVNVTVNVGHTRMLTMALANDFYKAQSHFEFVHGSAFKLMPSDEIDLPRFIRKYSIHMDHYVHGMVTPVEAGGISVGFICRHVEHMREVDLANSCIVPTRMEMLAGNCEARDAAYSFFKSHLQLYHARIDVLVQDALDAWP